MTLSSTEQALVQLLTRFYHEIAALEAAWRLQVSDTDFRPRIDGVHDAVRALASDGGDAERLNVEWLAYDMEMLRYIIAHPMQKPAASLGAIVTIPAARGPSSQDKQRLIEGYKNYAVVFSALFAVPAETDYQERAGQFAEQEEALAHLQAHLREAMSKQGARIDIRALLQEAGIEDAAMLAAATSPEDAARATATLRAHNRQAQAKLDKAHLSYVTAQLFLYQTSRAIVKKLAETGANLVGSFITNAVRDAERGERGR